jgi:aquaporin Z
MALRPTTNQGQQLRIVLPAGVDPELARKCVAEFVGTMLLVFFGAGVATVSFGFRAYGTSVSAGVVATALAFALVLIGLVAVVGPISGCHVNPAVTFGAYLAKRIDPVDAVAYVIAQLVGGIIGALLLWWVMHGSSFYVRSRNGLGANGYGSLSLLHMSGGGAFLAEIIMTAVFVLIVLSATRKDASPAVAGLIVGLSLGLVNLVGIPIDGCSVNPARSLGPALVAGGLALSQVWLFLLAPMVGAVLGAGVHILLHPMPAGASGGPAGGGGGSASDPVPEPEADQPEASDEARPAGRGAGATAERPRSPNEATRAGSGPRIGSDDPSAGGRRLEPVSAR